VDRERVAVFVVFALNGAVLGSWAPRVPALTAQVQAAPGAFGLALLGGSVGMVLAASVSGRLLEWVGSRALIVIASVAAFVILPLLGVAGSVLWLGITLVGLGAAIGMVDVAMNMAAVLVERRVSKPIMPVFHAGFSFGALAGSVGAGVAAAHGLSPVRHLALAGVAGVVVLVAFTRWLPGGGAPVRSSEAAPAGGAVPVRRLVLWLLAGVAMCSAIAEGASSDWSALFMVTEHGLSEGAAALAFSGFALAMALARLAGAWLQERFGATRTLVGGAAVAAVALWTAALVPSPVPSPVAGYLGFALGGAGLAAAFPIALSLAGEAGKRADNTGGEREIAFVAGVAYSGFLAGPPAIGAIAQVTSLSVSFIAVGLIAALIAAAAIGARRARDRELVPARCLTASPATVNGDASRQ
jgi:MFS family permease